MPEQPNPATAAPQGQPQQPPFGASPVSQASPNRGYEAAALQKLALVGKQLTEILNMVGVGSDVGKEVYKMLGSIAKLAPAGSVSNASERNNIEQMAMKNAQQNSMLAQLKQGGGAPGGAPGGGGAPPGAQGAPPGGAMPRAA